MALRRTKQTSWHSPHLKTVISTSRTKYQLGHAQLPLLCSPPQANVTLITQNAANLNCSAYEFENCDFGHGYRLPNIQDLPYCFHCLCNSDNFFGDYAMKTLTAVFLLLVSTSALAQKPPCSYEPQGCVGNPPGLNKTSTVPVPGTLALLGLGIAGLAIARKRR